MDSHASHHSPRSPPQFPWHSSRKKIYFLPGLSSHMATQRVYLSFVISTPLSVLPPLHGHGFWIIASQWHHSRILRSIDVTPLMSQSEWTGLGWRGARNRHQNLQECFVSFSPTPEVFVSHKTCEKDTP